MENFINKTVTIIGLSERTGIAVAEKMIDLGAEVIISDIKSKEDLKPQLSILDKYENIIYDLGGHSAKILDTDLIVLSPGVPSDLEIIKKAEKMGIEVISEIELAYRLTDANIIGITGTNGKTTVTSLTGHILKQNLDCRVRVAGNIGSPLITEITALSENDWLVVELSSFQLEKIKNFKSDIGVFLNFSPDHLDRHKTVKNYWNAKKRIFENQNKDDIAIINYDDNYLRDNLKNLNSNTYLITNNFDIEQGIFYNKDSIFQIQKELEDKSKILDTKYIPLIGSHNILNTAFAVLIAKLFYIDNESIKNAVISYKAFAHRLEVIYDKKYKVIDDSKATNPHAAVNAMRSIEMPIVLIAGGQDRDANFEDFAYTVKQRVKKIILLGETKEAIKQELDNLNYDNYYLVKNMQEAVLEAFKNIDINDTVLLSPGCPSWDMYESYKKRGLEFQEEVEHFIK
ncbi:MAG TPA: UDP-N-acetylmuramoyl-L-alanine--D-glutamate ligase [Halanaerobiales bacterium]|nr:UDP-N-acetylmuramoyl-L-alanine--D-glutamate ligase [Halanaerobiales bacterium]